MLAERDDADMYVIGIDTGGTYTDGIIMDYETKEVAHSVKVFTTKEDLSICINRCFQSLDIETYRNEGICSICISTTLATNAIIEGTSCSSGMILVGKVPEHELPDAAYQFVDGLLDIKGYVKVPLDEKELDEKLKLLIQEDKSIEAVGISCYASTRNPSFEQRIKRKVQEELGVPVVCAHELTTKLGFQERTVSTVLNAGLIPIITELIDAVEEVIDRYQLHANMMVVDGSGCLLYSRIVTDQPIQTILSGPASSMIGGQYLTGIQEGLIVDIGGTTTDIAVVRDGKVALNEMGATVGNWKTSTVAAEISTFGLGGDSRIYIDEEGRLSLSSTRQWPISYMTQKYPALWKELEQYRNSPQYSDLEVFSAYRKSDCRKLRNDERQVMLQLESQPHTRGYLRDALGVANVEDVLQRLIAKNRIIGGGFTPTDLMHAMGSYTPFDRRSSEYVISCFAARLNCSAETVIERLKQLVAERLADCCRTVSEHYLELPIVCIGAPARAWVDIAGEHLGRGVIVPEHAEVANAIGAAIGNISPSVDVLIRPDVRNHVYIMYMKEERQEFQSLESAKEHAMLLARKRIREIAAENRCSNYEIYEDVQDVMADDSLGRRYVETRISIMAVGKPDIYYD